MLCNALGMAPRKRHPLNITLPPKLIAQIRRHCARLGLPISFYLQTLAQADLAAKEDDRART